MTQLVLLTLDGSDKDERAIAVSAALIELADVDAHVLIAATLLEEIERHDPDFVVMATRAAGPVGRAMLGSVSDRLVRESPKPVLLVPPRASYLGGRKVTVRRVLVPLDGSAAALRMIPRLLALPRANMLELVLLQVVQPEQTGGHRTPPGTPESRIDALADGDWTHVQAAVAEQRLDAVASRLRARGSQAAVRVVEARDPGAAIIDSVRNDLVELIAMSTRGASGLQRLVLGSVAEYVVRRSEIPVLLVTARSGAAVPLSA